MPQPPKKPDKVKLKQWLKNHGHNAAKIDKLKLDTDAEMKTAIYELHGIEG